MTTYSDEYDRSVLDRDGLLAAAAATAALARGRVVTQAVEGREFWELGRVIRERSRRAERSEDGKFSFGGRVGGDLVGLKPDGTLVEVRFSQGAGSSYAPPPMGLGDFDTQWEENPFGADWHFQILDEANIGLPREEMTGDSASFTHDESLDSQYVAIACHKGQGLQRALAELAALARQLTELGDTVPFGPAEPLTTGVYWTVMGDDREYLRFFADGRVFGASSSSGPAEVSRWLGPGSRGVAEGTFSTVGHHLEFTTRRSTGALAYRGTIESPQQLVLSSRSFINGRVRSAAVYGFFESDADGIDPANVPTNEDLDAGLRGTSAGSESGSRPTAWPDLNAFVDRYYPLAQGHGPWPCVEFGLEDGGSQFVSIRPRSTDERAWIELSTEFTTAAKVASTAMLARVHDFRFGGVVAVGDSLFFRHTVRLGDFTTDEFQDFLDLVATYGGVLQAEFGGA